ncbi:TonB-dependent siderophore receptor [uncultured Phenylobacterium sp.]|uniref:TonB-dependent receptor plug domain-containing protein n=1 Tax=uncultured Phenylobacterium sp. TaxID=349273 RepID=UPI0025F630D3|nr:TonB-dependent receptor [uncultured Phenylobacterium sp.]
MNKAMLFAVVSLAPLLAATVAWCADGGAAADEAEAARTVEELVVTGEIAFRNRTEAAAPTLSYDLDYFQRFEPLTAGDALKRVPSVAFLSDVLESDGARLRGLDPGYTQILINGERVPGAGLDRSFFVDRIPAELIDRVEVVRSSSANRSGDAVAGALNIVLRDALALDGGYLRAGAIRLDDGKFKGTAGGVWGGQVGPGRMLIGASVQGRRNPKDKFSQRFDEPDGELDNVEVQTDVRDGTDYSFNAAYNLDVGASNLDLSGFFVRTDRLQAERSIEYAAGVQTEAQLETINVNDLDIVTDNYALNGRYKLPLFGGETTFKLGYAVLDDDQSEFEDETTYDGDDTPFPDDDVFESTRSQTNIKDREWSGALQHKLNLSDAIGIEFGVQFVDKERATDILETETEVEIDDPPAPRPPIPGPYDPFAPVDGGVNTIEERRIDPYLMVSGKSGPLTWEAGVRYETTESKIVDETVATANRVSKNDYNVLLPSANLRYALSEANRISLSISRTVRRPNFNFLSPALLQGEYGDNDFLGNPGLKPEKAWGVDLGFERRLGRRGVFGVNVFYRDVKDLQELVNTGAFSDEARDNFDDAIDGGATPAEAAEELTSFVLTAANVGDGEVYGIEVDLSTPLDFMGAPDTGVFVNYSLLDSKVTDAFGSRRFNDQSKYVFNVGFIQDLPDWGAAFGATYRKQGAAFGRIVGEEVRTTYGADLELFVEKRFGERFVVRLTGSNLLDGKKREVFDKFNTIGDQISRDHDEYELESEKAGPVFQLVARATF